MKNKYPFILNIVLTQSNWFRTQGIIIFALSKMSCSYFYVVIKLIVEALASLLTECNCCILMWLSQGNSSLYNTLVHIHKNNDKKHVAIPYLLLYLLAYFHALFVVTWLYVSIRPRFIIAYSAVPELVHFPFAVIINKFNVLASTLFYFIFMKKSIGRGSSLY